MRKTIGDGKFHDVEIVRNNIRSEILGFHSLVF